MTWNTDVVFLKGEEVASSHKVQSVRAVVEQTIADLKQSKVMESNKIKSVAAFEKVLDCVIGLHNLRVLRKANPHFIATFQPGETRFRENIFSNHLFHQVMSISKFLQMNLISRWKCIAIFVSSRIFCLLLLQQSGGH